MNVLFLSPAYPPEMVQFTRGLAEVGATVWAVGDQPLQQVARDLKGLVHAYLPVPRILDEADVITRVLAWLNGRTPDRIETNWEPLTLTAAALREALGVPGMSRKQVELFRDKPSMRAAVAAAGLRAPRTVRVHSRAELREAALFTGFPLILKPVAGAGSADTHRIDSTEQLEAMIRLVDRMELSCEEFVTGDELTYDTICLNGKPVYESVSYYLPNVLDARNHEWVSPITMTVRDLSHPAVAGGIELGRAVLKALGMGTGFTHMEWFRNAAGDAVFGEIASRSPGACMVDLMNYTSDIDLFREWARVVCHGQFVADATRRFNTAIIFKRAQGQGRIRGSSGLDQFRAKYGRYIAREDFLKPGAERRDWKQTFLSDGHIVVRHPDHDAAREMADEAARSIAVYAG